LASEVAAVEVGCLEGRGCWRREIRGLEGSGCQLTKYGHVSSMMKQCSGAMELLFPSWSQNCRCGTHVDRMETTPPPPQRPCARIMRLTCPKPQCIAPPASCSHLSRNNSVPNLQPPWFLPYLHLTNIGLSFRGETWQSVINVPPAFPQVARKCGVSGRVWLKPTGTEPSATLGKIDANYNLPLPTPARKNA